MVTQAADNVAGLTVPDTPLAHDLTEFVRETEADLLFHHLRRVYFFGALQTDAEARGLTSNC